jgi:hypothetical protein
MAAESAVVLARRPLVVFGLDEHQRERQAVARQRLRQRDDVGHDAGFLEAEEPPVRPHPTWMSSTISRMPCCCVISRRRCSQALLATLTPPSACTVSTITAAGMSMPLPLVLQHGLEVVERVGVLAQVAVEGHRGAMAQRHTGAGALEAVAGHGQRPERHAVEGVGEADHLLASGDLARELERGFDGIGAGGAGELELVAQAARLRITSLNRSMKRCLASLYMSSVWVMPSRIR